MTVSVHDFISTTDRRGAACSERYSEDFLEAYSLGTQKGGETVDFEQHLTLCATCQVRLAEVECWIQLLRKSLDGGSSLNTAPATTGKLLHMG